MTSATALGGKAGGPPASGLLHKTGQSLLEETLAPLADNLAWRIKARSDDIVGESLGGQ
ncbi:MAG: hypothetical protein WAO55_06375 [Candidatus Manganitrophaceae bacterium]